MSLKASRSQEPVGIREGTQGADTRPGRISYTDSKRLNICVCLTQSCTMIKGKLVWSREIGDLAPNSVLEEVFGKLSSAEDKAQFEKLRHELLGE